MTSLKNEWSTAPPQQQYSQTEMGQPIKYLEEAHEERPVRTTELWSIWRETQPPTELEFEEDKEKDLVEKEGNWIPREGNLTNFSGKVRIQIHLFIQLGIQQ